MIKLAIYALLLLALVPAAVRLRAWTPAQAPSGAPSGAPSLKATLLGNENAFAEAQKKKDAARLQQQLAPDFTGVGTNGQPFGRDEMREAFNEITLEEYTIYNAEAVTVDDGAALLTYDAIVRISGGDSVIPRYQRVSSLWVNQTGEWKLKFQQATAKKWGD
jgi:hypothetical protein